MSTGAIKPPGGGPGPIEGSEGAAELDAAQGASESQAPAQATGQAEGGTAAWLQRVDAGEITAEQAVDGIVAQALEAPGAAALSNSQRAELESSLRAALLDDPSLRALVGG